MAPKPLGYSPSNTPANVDLDALHTTATNALGTAVIAEADAQTAIAAAAAAQATANQALLGIGYNIKAYGALVDGVTDDSAAIRAAIAACVAGGGGAVIFPAGVCIGAAEIFTSGVLFVGQGSGVSTLRQPATVMRTVANGAINIGTPTYSSATGAFTNADLQKRILIAGAGPAGGFFAARIIGITNGTTVTLSQNADTSVVGATTYINCGSNVAEFNKCYKGNSAVQLTGLGCVGMTLDGNRANVGLPPADVVNHGAPFTNVKYLYVRDLKAINCFCSGFGAFITSDFARVSDVYTSNCGNTTTGTVAFDINSSSYGVYLGHVSESDFYGARFLDNCNNNVYDGSIKLAKNHGFILNNQNANYSSGNRMRVVVDQPICATGVGAIIGANWRGNDIDIVVTYAGCTRTGPNTFTVQNAIVGIQVGVETLADALKPQGNRLKLTAYRSGGEGIVNRGNYNSLDVALIENSQGAQGAHYALENNGSWNRITGAFMDFTVASGLWRQRGIANRAAGGEVGTPATGNIFVAILGADASAIDETGTSSRYIGIIDPVNSRTWGKVVLPVSDATYGASLSWPVGVAPGGVIADGDEWYDGVKKQFRIGATTETVGIAVPVATPAAAGAVYGATEQTLLNAIRSMLVSARWFT